MAASNPMIVLEAPSIKAKDTKKTPPVNVIIACVANPSFIMFFNPSLISSSDSFSFTEKFILKSSLSVYACFHLFESAVLEAYIKTFPCFEASLFGIPSSPAINFFMLYNFSDLERLMKK